VTRSLPAVRDDRKHQSGNPANAIVWHFNARPSNTEPLLRLNLEGRTRGTMEARRDEVLAFIRS
jgi:phosphomannomutase